MICNNIWVKIIKCDVWNRGTAAEYGRTMYNICQRIGPLYMKMLKRYGKKEDAGELTEKKIIRPREIHESLAVKLEKSKCKIT